MKAGVRAGEQDLWCNPSRVRTARRLGPRTRNSPVALGSPQRCTCRSVAISACSRSFLLKETPTAARLFLWAQSLAEQTGSAAGWGASAAPPRALSRLDLLCEVAAVSAQSALLTIMHLQISKALKINIDRAEEWLTVKHAVQFAGQD